MAILEGVRIFENDFQDTLIVESYLQNAILWVNSDAIGPWKF